MKRPLITLLTDFGISDYYVGAMKGVILSLCPEAEVIDITHEIAPWQIRHGAWTLAQTWACFPPGTIHVAVVDPGVGSPRLPILAEAGGHFFVAPDNGILSGVFSAAPPSSVRTLSETAFFRRPVSSTFHGRDIFSPVAAHLANGVASARFGPLQPGFVALPDPLVRQVETHAWEGEVLWIDHFGNVVTSFDLNRFPWLAATAFVLQIGDILVTQYFSYYGAMESGKPALIQGSAGLLEVSLNQQHAGRFLGVEPGARLLLRRF